MRKRCFLWKLLSFFLGIIFFCIFCKLQYEATNPLMNYLFSFKCLFFAISFIFHNPSVLIFFLIPLITVILEIFSIKSNSKVVFVSLCVFLCLFNLNQYFIYINIMSI